MDILNILIGLFMIGIGFLVKSSPHLISGYNTMSEERKKNVDIEGLSTFMRNGLIVIGLTIIIGYFLFKWIGLTTIAHLMILIASLGGIVILVVKAQQFDHNKTKNTWIAYVILGLVITLVTGFLVYSFIPSKMVYSKETVRFSGMYGFEAIVAEITDVELTDKLPAITMRTNGFSLGSTKKGFFKLDSLGTCRLLVHSDTPLYLLLSLNNGETAIINYKDQSETEKAYRQVKTLLGK